MLPRNTHSRGTQTVVLTLYRECLKWTRDSLVRTCRFQCANLPPGLASLRLPVELLTNSSGVREAIRQTFRRHASLKSPRAISEQVDLGFEALRYLTGYREALKEVDRRRELNRDREGIHFRVGQVVRHKVYGYRAVVLGWDRRPTQKVSDWDGVVGLPSGSEQPFYHLMPDDGDAEHLLSGQQAPLFYLAQEHLEQAPLLDSRVSSSALSSCFEYFDEATGAFVPKEQVLWQYPADALQGRHTAAGGGRRRRASALDVQEAKAVDASRRIEKTIRKLATVLLGELQAKNAPLEAFDEPVRGLLELLVFIRDGPLPPGAAPSSAPLAQTRREQYNGSVDRMYMGTAGLSPLLTSQASGGDKTVEWQYTKAPMHPALAKTYGGYRALGAIHEVFRASDDLWTRRSLSRNREGVQFSVGQVVRHRKDGFRAVVCGWERPGELLSLSRKDQSLPRSSPSYRVILDEEDRTAASEPRAAMSLVPQDDLEAAAEGEGALLQSPLIPEFFEHYDPSIGKYYPNTTLRFQFPRDFEPREVLSPEGRARLKKAERVIATIVRALRRLVNTTNRGEQIKKDLLLLLRNAKQKADATVVERLLWHCWSAHPDEHVHALMDDGLHQLVTGQYGQAVARFTEVLDHDPDFAEAYNERGKAYFLQNKYKESLADSQKALQLEPSHFSALQGMGLSHMHLEQYDEAVKALTATLKIHPWINGVGTSLQVARKHLEEEEEERGSRHTRGGRYDMWSGGRTKV